MNIEHIVLRHKIATKYELVPHWLRIKIGLLCQNQREHTYAQQQQQHEHCIAIRNVKKTKSLVTHANCVYVIM